MTERIGPLYRDGRHYDALNSFLVADIPFYVEEARKAAGVANPYPPAKGAGRMGHPVLELACGTGRLTIPIAQTGVEIVGLDLSASMLAHARTKAKATGVEIEFIEGDCRSFDLGQKFALIFMAFNSLQHLHDYASLSALFANVRKHLSEGGRFVFDVFNPKLEILARASGDRRFEREYQDPDGRGMMAFEHSATYDDASQVSNILCYFVRRGANGEEVEVREEELHLRSFFPQELDLLVRSQGFEIVEKFGNFEQKEFGSSDPKQVVVCRSKWNSVMLGTGVKLSELSRDADRIEKPHFSLVDIRHWRASEAEAERPSGLRDFYAAHGFCFDCRSRGVITTGYDEQEMDYLYSLCPNCAGTGRVRVD
jgi:SAM-dependent methyltransferase